MQAPLLFLFFLLEQNDNQYTTQLLAGGILYFFTATFMSQCTYGLVEQLHINQSYDQVI